MAVTLFLIVFLFEVLPRFAPAHHPKTRSAVTRLMVSNKYYILNICSYARITLKFSMTFQRAGSEY